MSNERGVSRKAEEGDDEWDEIKRRRGVVVARRVRKERSRESRVFRYYGIGSEHGPRDASPVATAWSGYDDHNDDGRDAGQHDAVIVDHYDASRHEWRAAVPSTTGVQSRATDGQIAQTRSCEQPRGGHLSHGP